jgi:hypothetical protein
MPGKEEEELGRGTRVVSPGLLGDGNGIGIDRGEEPKTASSPLSLQETRRGIPISQTFETMNSTQVDQDRAVLSRSRTVQIDEPYRRRQSIRALSLRQNTLDHRTSTIRSGQVDSVPEPGSKYTNHIPHPLQSQHSGFGGFPGPLKLFKSILPHSTNSQLERRLTRTETGVTLLTNSRRRVFDKDEHPGFKRHREGDMERGGAWGDQVRAHVAHWMPENLGGLVIGRNSRFYTEELGDEELEQLGGVEYRALRLLGYLVGSVSPGAFGESMAQS